VSYVVFDTNIASLTVKGRMPAALAARLVGTVEIVSFVTVGELAKWSEVRSWGERQLGVLDLWLRQRPVIESSEEVSLTWGRLAAWLQRRGVPYSDNDGWIAACCLHEGLPLVTRNVKDFTDVASEHGLVLITE